MTFLWKHPKYYEELKKKLKEQQADENNQDSENNKDTEPESPQE
jgi:hypothetical protein